MADGPGGNETEDTAQSGLPGQEALELMFRPPPG
jgi:hypothetical protein